MLESAPAIIDATYDAWLSIIFMSCDFNNRAAVDRFGLRLANLDRRQAVLRGDHVGRLAVADRLDHVSDFHAIAIRIVEFDRARPLARLNHMQRFGAAAKVEIERGALALHSVGHLESFRQKPAALRMNHRPARIKILGYDMINRCSGTDNAC